MSMLQAFADKRFASARRESAPPMQLESDYAANGWPARIILAKMEAAGREGRGALGWDSIEVQGKPYLTMGWASDAGAMHALVDPATKSAAFRVGDAMVEGSFEEVAQALALATQKGSARHRRTDSVALRRGLWQHEASVAALDAPAGRSGFHAQAGEDPRQAWDRQFDAIDAHASRFGDSVAEIDKVRAQFMGEASSAPASALIQEAVDAKAGHVEVAGQRAAFACVGIRGAQLRVAIPLRADGSIAPNLPMMAVLARQGEGKAEPADPADPNQEPMRFYHPEALAKWIHSAQSMEMAGQAPVMLPGKLSSWRRGREADAAPGMAQPSKPAGPG